MPRAAFHIKKITQLFQTELIVSFSSAMFSKHAIVIRNNVSTSYFSLKSWKLFAHSIAFLICCCVSNWCHDGWLTHVKFSLISINICIYPSHIVSTIYGDFNWQWAKVLSRRSLFCASFAKEIARTAYRCFFSFSVDRRWVWRIYNRVRRAPRESSTSRERSAKVSLDTYRYAERAQGTA
jgi:hypothetical protein